MRRVDRQALVRVAAVFLFFGLCVAVAIYGATR